MFWITFGLFVITTILFDIYASGDIQPWNDLSQEIKVHTTTPSGENNEKQNISGKYV